MHDALPPGTARLEPGAPATVVGWRSRGYLPHFEDSEKIQHVMFHLADSLPAEAVARLDEESQLLPPEKQDAFRRQRIDAWIDAGHGSCSLRDPAVAAGVQDSLLHFDAERYRMLAWVVMPNHVHVLFQPLAGWTVGKIVASWKSFTGRRISERAARERGGPVPGSAGLLPGRIWQREYWDRFMRGDSHLRQTVDYIHQNPVKAGLVARAEEWRWSSARLGGGGGTATLQRGCAGGKPDPARLEPGAPGSEAPA